MSRQTFLITSALYTNYGIYNPQQRIQQTLATAKSARQYQPDSLLILIDNSKIDVQNENSAEFNELLDVVDYYIDNSEDPDIQHFHNTVSNYDIGKNAMECLGFIKALRTIQTTPEISDEVIKTNRIFKLSGRYELTDKFDITQHDNDQTAGKYVFKTAQASWCDQTVTGVDKLLQTRLYSFTPDLLDETVLMFDAIIKNMFATFNNKQYIDVEHSMWKFINKDKLIQLDTVGLKGNIAPNGMIVID